MIAKILIADDNDQLRKMLRAFLEAKHHIVLEATDGAQAFTIAEEEMPHLIIMDIVMPGVYGSSATKQIQEYWRTSDIPIILMSGSVEQSLLKDLLQRPNIRFLKKPVEMKVLEETIKEISACSPLIIRLNKRAVKAHMGKDFSAAVEGVSDLFLNTLMKTEDTLEGIASFYEKRRPEWKNK